MMKVNPMFVNKIIYGTDFTSRGFLFFLFIFFFNS